MRTVLRLQAQAARAEPPAIRVLGGPELRMAGPAPVPRAGRPALRPRGPRGLRAAARLAIRRAGRVAIRPAARIKARQGQAQAAAQLEPREVRAVVNLEASAAKREAPGAAAGR